MAEPDEQGKVKAEDGAGGGAEGPVDDGESVRPDGSGHAAADKAAAVRGARARAGTGGEELEPFDFSLAGLMDEELSREPAPAVEEFMEESAQANEAEAESLEVEAKPGPYISFENVSKSFDSFVVLEDVSFCVDPGETLCILGRSGVGKSVSLQMLMGFLKPDSGTVLVAGQDIAGMSEAELQEVRRKVTMVFQNGALFDSISVGENVAFPLRERGAMEEDQILQVVKGLLEMVGVAGMEDLLPSDLSTGMKRSVAIARALAAQPSAILYDEPTTMVDPLMAHLLGDLIQRLKEQLHLTSIIVTHDMRFAEKLADRVVFLHEGKARFFGTMEEMRRSEDAVLKEFLLMDELLLPA
jgi:phospholipid/cholesterol/gamma-HCH transport system ATP-binding protein